ncbi:MAG TPA: hypothetical protein VGL66_16460 [Caulobacteraceae bacterium]|jgi:hypothetical protein
MGTKTKTSRALALSLAVCATAALPAAAQATQTIRYRPVPGVHAYHYEVIETVNGQPTHAYRTDFDLQVNRDGSIDAIVRSAQESDGKTWSPVKLTDDCLAKMHAPKGGIATARIWPTTKDPSAAMGNSFLDLCAPPAVFFPLTDIVNVVVISVADAKLPSELRKPGDTAHFAGFTAHYDRAGEGLTETTHGGVTTLESVDAKVATLKWAPALADLDLSEHTAQGQAMKMIGVEHWSFRVEIDRHTGALIRAKTPYDDLDLTVHMQGLPEDKAPKVKIVRVVTIEPR